MKRPAGLVLALVFLWQPARFAEAEGFDGVNALLISPSERSQEVERAEVYGGFSHFHSGSAGLDGWEVSGALPFHQRLQIVADLAHQWTSYGGADLTASTFLVGLARGGRFHRFRPFGRALIGVVHNSASAAGLTDSGNDPTLGAGVGVAYPLSRAIGACGQVDLLLSHGNGTWDIGPRWGIGIKYRLGK